MDCDIIEPVEGPTPWVSPVVVVPKPSADIRLCVDMTKANEAIVRERNPIYLTRLSWSNSLVLLHIHYSQGVVQV